MGIQVDLLERLRNLEIDDLSSVARDVLANPEASVDDKWSCNPMSTVSIGNGTLGFFKFTGAASIADVTVPWSVVVKAMDPSVDSNKANHPLREISAYGSGFPPPNQPGMKAALCYKVEPQPDGTVWLWLQDLTHLGKQRWSAEDYMFAAKRVGLINGAGPESVAEGMDWIDRTGTSDRRAAPVAEGKAELFQRALGDPIVQRTASHIGLRRAEELFEDVERLVEASAEFPKLISHNDCHTRNLFIDSGASELIAIDWASVGLTPAGVDGGSLIASGFTWGHDEARMVTSVEGEAFDAYCEGLTEAGWKQPRDEVRLVFLTMAATYTLQTLGVVYQATINPRFEQMVTARVAPTLEEVADEFSERQSWALPMIDEALSLIGG